jgi:hypothetical protein
MTASPILVSSVPVASRTSRVLAFSFTQKITIVTCLIAGKCPPKAGIYGKPLDDVIKIGRGPEPSRFDQAPLLGFVLRHYRTTNQRVTLPLWQPVPTGSVGLVSLPCVSF